MCCQNDEIAVSIFSKPCRTKYTFYPDLEDHEDPTEIDVALNTMLDELVVEPETIACDKFS